MILTANSIEEHGVIEQLLYYIQLLDYILKEKDMTEKEFKEVKKIHKKIWNGLAESGDRYKPEEAYVFAFRCPSCEIALATADYMELKTGHPVHRCVYCPILLWRNNLIGDFAPCESHHDHKISIYHKWGLARINDRKKLAKKIANLKWEWISEYQYANIENILELYKSKFD